MFLFFDTETTGLPIDREAPVTDLDNWPRLVQLAYLLHDTDGNLLSEGDYIIRPEGFIIPAESTSIHGITNERALDEGLPLKDVLTSFYAMMKRADFLVAHNIWFDENIIGAEFLRCGMPNYLDDWKKICTMESSIDYCAIKGQYGYKRPRLSALHQKLFGCDFAEAHNAAFDIEATARCFWGLRRLGIINV